MIDHTYETCEPFKLALQSRGTIKANIEIFLTSISKTSTSKFKTLALVTEIRL